jgi:peptide-N4-(N-acetyl-beta-glucosaminyl)asparagine amidase
VPISLLADRARDNVFKLADAKDEFIVQLLKWFKHEFFTWVNEMPCQGCKGKTANRGSMRERFTEGFVFAIVLLWNCCCNAV